MVPFDEMNSYYMHFFLPLKLIKKIWARVDFWIQVDFLFLNVYLGLLMSWIGLSRFLQCFIGVLSHKLVEKTGI